MSVLMSLGALAQNLQDQIRLRVEKPDGIYSVGETVRVWADVSEVPEGELTFRVFRNGSLKAVSTEPITLAQGSTLLLEQSYSEPVHVFLGINRGKKPVMKSKDDVFAGFIVNPGDFTPGFDEPADLLKYWNREIKAMRKMKIKAARTEVSDKLPEGISCVEVELNCVGPKPVRGYMAWPSDAGKKSLPIIIFLHAAGNNAHTSAHVKNAVNYAKTYHALAIDINAQGMLNQQPDEYYKEIYGKGGELYRYSSREPALDDYIFKWMFLRAERTVDYMVTNPLWDGKHLIVTGTSQGGGQSSFLAGIDPRITAAAIRVPAMLDQGASLKGRECSWPKTMRKYPESTTAYSPYFDPSLLLKYTKADIWCEIGLYDTTCPAANVFAAMNTVPEAQKTIVTYQRGHTVFAGPKKLHNVVDKQVEAFIKAQCTK